MTIKYRAVLVNEREDQKDLPGGGGSFDFDNLHSDDRPKTDWFNTVVEAEDAGTALNYELCQGDLYKEIEIGVAVLVEGDKEIVLTSRMRDVVYSPVDDHEIHRANVNISSNGELTLHLACGLGSGNPLEGFYYSTPSAGVMLGNNNYCGYCFNR